MNADTIWFNAKIRTGDPNRPSATAIAASGGKILAVGQDADVLNLAGPGTQSLDMGGKSILPGFVESHTHALWGACQELYEVNVSYGASYDVLIEAVRTKLAQTEPGTMISGGPWRHDMRPAMGKNPRATLDALSSDVPIALADVTKHLLWCNSLALSLAGLHDDVEDIQGGVIERDPVTGAPNGILAETAADIVRELEPLFRFVIEQQNPPPTAERIPPTGDKELVFNAVGYDPTDVNSVVEGSGLTVDRVSSMLVLLDLEALIQPAPGGCYVRI